MNSSNGTLDPSCPYRQWYTEAGSVTSFIVFYTLAPVTAVISFSAHLLFIFAFRAQSKKNSAYSYQLLVAVTEAVRGVTFSLYLVTVEWAASPRSTSLVWHGYSSCYPCMLFSAYAPIGLHNAVTSAAMMLSVCVTADRLYALWKPFSYKTVDHKRMRALTVAFSVFLGVLINLFHCFRFTVQPIQSPGGTVSYQNVLDASFAASLLGKVLNHVRNTVEALLLLALYACNTGLLWFHRVRGKEAEKNLGTRTAREKRRRETERTLTLLAITQSLCVTVNSTLKTIFYTVIFFQPSFYTCSGRLYAPLLVAWVQALNFCDVICIVAVSKNFRAAFVKFLSCCKKPNAIDPIDEALPPAWTESRH